MFIICIICGAIYGASQIGSAEGIITGVIGGGILWLGIKILGFILKFGDRNKEKIADIFEDD